MSTGVPLLGNREQAAAALAAGRTFRAAARLAGCSARTLHRWRREPAFAARVREIGGELLQRTLGLVSAAAPAAAVKLKALLRSDNERVAAGAAAKLLDVVVHLKDVFEFEARLAALEHQQHGEGES